MKSLFLLLGCKEYFNKYNKSYFEEDYQLWLYTDVSSYSKEMRG